MVLSALYLASTTSMITLSFMRSSRLQRKLQKNKVELKYVSERRKFSYCYGLCFFWIFVLHFIILKLPSNTRCFNSVSIDVCFFHKSKYVLTSKSCV